jgi:NADH-quinone oxidoreductase subunit M
METMEYLLLLLIALPTIGAIVCALVPKDRLAKGPALAISLVCAVISLVLLSRFDWTNPDPQFVASFGRLETIGFDLRLGVDSISLWLVALTTLLQPLAIAASFDAIRDRAKEYYAWMLVLLAAMVGVFLARDALLFYVFFELTLIPMFFVIGIWGGPQRRYAAGKFFLFTFAGSVFTLAALIYLHTKAAATGSPTFDIAQLLRFAHANLTPTQLLWVSLGFLAGFAVKVPLFPVHTWLPLAHTEAPTAGSVILAGVLLKLGTYGILRFVLPLGFYHPEHGLLWPAFVKTVAVFSIIGIIYGALVAWVQQDIKKLVAYSSVSHLGFCVLGLAALNHEGVQGSILYMINHGLSTGALFLVIGMIYDRYHTRDINELSGLAARMPVLAFFFILFTLSSIGLPGLNGFVSEFLTILGAFKSPHLGVTYGAFAALGIILGAVYMLHMTARVIWGPLKTPGHTAAGHGHAIETGVHGEETKHVTHGQADQGQAASPGHDHDGPTLPTDIGGREISILAPLAIAVVVLGVIPAKLLRTLEPPVRQLIGSGDGAPNQKAGPSLTQTVVTAETP